jgi:hypothetical protein
MTYGPRGLRLRSLGNSRGSHAPVLAIWDIRSEKPEMWVLPLEMVDKSTSPLQTHFGPVFCHEAVRTGLLFPERGSIRVLLLAPLPTSSRHDTPSTSGLRGAQAETGGKGQESTSHAVHRRCVLPTAIAGVRCR